MKAYQMSDTRAALTARLNSFIWALLLLMPVLLVANTANNRLLFHLLLFFTGWLSWTFTEYYLHRFVMHDGNQKKGFGKLLNHDHHHKDPADIIISNLHRILLISGSFVLIFLSVFLDNYFTLVDGFVTGFTCYSFMHIMLHMKWSGKLFPQLHEFHIHHHCKYPDKCFGITFTWWDHLFGTIPLKDAAITERIRAFYYKNENSNQAMAGKFHQTCGQTERIGKKISVSGDQGPEIPGSNNNTENDSWEK